MNPTDQIPTLFAWAGGTESLRKLTAVFYDKVLADPILQPIFEHMQADHPQRVADFLGEVLGGPRTYSEKFGGHAHMLSQHLNRGLTEVQRRRWVALLIDSADEAALPADPEFRSAFVAYIEWGTRLAVLNSQEGASPSLNEPMPSWGWGQVMGPYKP
jgi:hemoglobin